MDEKLRTVGELYDVMVDQFNEARSFFVEVAIAILALLDVIFWLRGEVEQLSTGRRALARGSPVSASARCRFATFCGFLFTERVSFVSRVTGRSLFHVAAVLPSDIREQAVARNRIRLLLRYVFGRGIFIAVFDQKPRRPAGVTAISPRPDQNPRALSTFPHKV